MIGKAPAASVAVPALRGATAPLYSLGLPNSPSRSLRPCASWGLALEFAAREPVLACAPSPLQAGENMLDACAGFQVLLGQPSDQGSCRKGVEEGAGHGHPIPAYALGEPSCPVSCTG